MSDLSGEDDAESKPAEETTTSKFLKKKKPSPVTAEPAKKPKVSESTASKTKPQSGRMGFSGASAALSKAAAFTSKYAKPIKKESLVLSDSDLDMDLSMDEDVSIFTAHQAHSCTHSWRKCLFHRFWHPSEFFLQILADVKTIKGNRASTQQIAKTISKPTLKKSASLDVSDDSEIGVFKSGSKFLKSSSKYGAISSEDEDSFEIGKGGSKFLKKKPKKEPEKKPSPEAKKPPISGMFFYDWFYNPFIFVVRKILKEAATLNSKRNKI